VLSGAIPFMLGWVAATGDFGEGALFLIQFWQFPHFWAIGWFLYEDYEKAGFFVCQQEKKIRVPLCRLFYIRFGLL
jgi:protoheme IX farnesyltransferase